MAAFTKGPRRIIMDVYLKLHIVSEVFAETDEPGVGTETSACFWRLPFVNLLRQDMVVQMHDEFCVLSFPAVIYISCIHL